MTQHSTPAQETQLPNATPATFTIGRGREATTYAIERIHTNGNISAIELGHTYPEHLAWRARVLITPRDGWYLFAAWNYGGALGESWVPGLVAAVAAHEARLAFEAAELEESERSGEQDPAGSFYPQMEAAIKVMARAFLVGLVEGGSAVWRLNHGGVSDYYRIRYDYAINRMRKGESVDLIGGGRFWNPGR